MGAKRYSLRRTEFSRPVAGRDSSGAHTTLYELWTLRFALNLFEILLNQLNGY